jgi:O-antigen ligase
MSEAKARYVALVSSLATAFFIVGAIAPDLQLPQAGLNLGNLILLFCLCLSVYFSSIANAMTRSRLRMESQHFVYLAYVVYCGMTMLWSVEKAETLMQSVLSLVLLASVVYMAPLRLSTVISLLILACTLISCVSLLSVAAGPSFAFQPISSSGSPELRGILKHQLRLGVVTSVGLGLWLIALFNRDLIPPLNYRRTVSVLLFVLVFVCMYAARARLYTAMMLLSLALTFAISRGGWLRHLSYAGLLILAVGGYVYGNEFLTALDRSGFDTTLTGRTLVWEKTLIAAEDVGWRGYGYATFDSPKFDWIWNIYRPPHAHNSLLEAYFETGMLGAVLLCAVVFVQLRRSVQLGGQSGRLSYSLYMVLFTALGSLTGVNYAGRLSFLFCVMMLVLAVESRTFSPQRMRQLSDGFGRSIRRIGASGTM